MVITHSTYLEGLIPLLKRLAKDPQVVTVTPAVSRVKGRARGSNCASRLPLPADKLVARRGTSAQEVFVVTPLGRSALQQRLNALLNHP